MFSLPRAALPARGGKEHTPALLSRDRKGSGSRGIRRSAPLTVAAPKRRAVTFILREGRQSRFGLSCSEARQLLRGAASCSELVPFNLDSNRFAVQPHDAACRRHPELTGAIEQRRPTDREFEARPDLRRDICGEQHTIAAEINRGPCALLWVVLFPQHAVSKLPLYRESFIFPLVHWRRSVSTELKPLRQETIVGSEQPTHPLWTRSWWEYVPGKSELLSETGTGDLPRTVP